MVPHPTPSINTALLYETLLVCRYAGFSAQALAFGVPSPIVEALAPSGSGSQDASASCIADTPVARRDAWPRRADAVHDGWDWSVKNDSGPSALTSSVVCADGRDGATATSNFSPADLSLIVGDLWPNSVLIDSAERTIWIVDWEAAQIGRPGRDVSLLIDHLWIMTQNPSKYDATRAKKLIGSFGSVFCPAYRGSSIVDWRLGREPEFFRSVVLHAGSPHYGIDHSTALGRALEEIAALSKLGIV